MARFRFVHAADLHLDTPFEGVGRVNPRVAEALRDASLAAWDNLVELTIASDAAFLLLAGDIYDGPQRGVRAQLRFLRGLERLAARGIAAFIVHGNHDSRNAWSAIRSWPPGITVFGSEDVHAVGVEREGERIATVHGVSYRQPEVTENLALRFRRGAEPGLHVGLLHCNLSGNAEHGPYSPCSVDDLRRAALDYWALGHVHKRAVVVERDPCVVYPGNLQGRGVRVTESGPKGAMVVGVVDERISETKFAAVDCIRFVRCPVDVSSCADLAEVRNAILRRGDELREENGERGLLLRCELVGAGPRTDLQRPGVLDDLLRDLREQETESAPLRWWQTIDDQTEPLLDREAIRGRADFSAELLRVTERLAGDPERRKAFLERRLDALRERGIARHLPRFEPDGADLLDAAERVALGLLAGEEEA